MTIKDNPYFKIVDAETVETVSKPKDMILSGDSWSVHLRQKKLFLDYVSGELAGREKSLEITKEEYEALKDGSLTIDSILIAHKVN